MGDGGTWATRTRRAAQAAAACLAIGAASMASAAAQDGDKPKGRKLTAAGAWTLALVRLNETSLMCAASTSDADAGAVFDYVVVNRVASAFRIAGAKVAAAETAPDALYVLQVDARDAVAIRGRREGGVALLPVDGDGAAKRQFIRDLAEGRTLEVRDEAGAPVGRFRLDGASKVLRAFGLCVARLPQG